MASTDYATVVAANAAANKIDALIAVKPLGAACLLSPIAHEFLKCRFVDRGALKGEQGRIQIEVDAEYEGR